MALIRMTQLSVRCAQIDVGLDNGAGDLAGDRVFDDTEVTGTKVVCTGLPYNPNVRYTFVTSTRYPGNFGGLAGGITACNTRAQAGGLPGTYHPYIKADGFNPGTDLITKNLPFVLQNGVRVADDMNALANSMLSVPIDQTEYGTTVFREVWTGVASNCTNFTSNSSSGTGTIGWSNQTDSTWQARFAQQCSRTDQSLYCMQD